MSKFSKVTIVLLAFFVVEAPLSHAQDRYAAFIHGFSFGDSRPEGVRDGERCELWGAVYELDTPFRQGACNNAWEKAGSRWEASGTPDRWTGGPVDGYIKLKYFDRDLYRGTPGGPRDVTLDDTHRKMMERFVKTMKHKMQENNSPNAKWVLVGHSQGGIVARLLHEHIRKNVDEVDVEGVLSVASPMQGGKPSQVSYGSRSGYKNVKPIIDGFLKDMLIGPVGDAASGILNFPFDVMFDIVANFWDPATYAADGIIDVAEGKLQALNEMAAAKEAKEAIGPDGELIQNINRAPDPDAYRALLGAERSPVPARVASGARTEESRVVTFGPLGVLGRIGLGIFESTSIHNHQLAAIFQADIKVKPGEEPVTVAFSDEVEYIYARAADRYRYRCYATIGLSCLGGDYRKWKRWKQGREAIQNFGSTYGEIVNAFRTEKKTRTRYVCDSPTMKSVSGGKKGAFDPPSAAEYAHPRIDEDRDCRYVSETYYTSVPNKNDGLLGTATNTWNPPRTRGSGPNLGSHSILYNDRPSSNQYKQGGTGYNHAEMVYNRRRYSASEDPGISDGEFSRGQLNPPMEEGRRFLERQVFR